MNEPEIDIKEIAKKILTTSPNLSDLSEAQLKEVANWYVKKNLTEQMENLIDASKVDLNRSRMLFLESFDSLYTKKAYLEALKKIETFCTRKKIDFLSLTPAIADEWILEERQSERASASIRKDIAAISSFYTFLERRHSFIKNPFRGTKVRPKKTSKKRLEVPDSNSFTLIVKSVSFPLSVIVELMGKTGLRAGAFETLSFYGQVMTASTKGKILRIRVGPDIIELIDNAGLPHLHPFDEWKAYRIENLLRYYTKKLFDEGKIKAVYSAHDFRHYFAVSEYTKKKDIYRVSKLLGHSSIQTTQLYLRSLNFDV